MLEERTQSDSVICKVWFLSDDSDAIFSVNITHHQLLSKEMLAKGHVRRHRGESYMNDTATMPRPTTTTRFLGVPLIPLTPFVSFAA